MEENRKNNETDLNDNSLNKFTDEVTQNKIDRHLTDINDTISEDDIKNISTDISSGPDVVIEEGADKAEITTSTDKKKNNKDDDQTDQLPTSWNVLD